MGCLLGRSGEAKALSSRAHPEGKTQGRGEDSEERDLVMTDTVAKRFFAALFHGEYFRRAIEASSKREAAAICHGFGIMSDCEGAVCVDGALDREAYFDENYPGKETSRARTHIEALRKMPSVVGRTIDYAGRITVEPWAPEETGQ